MSAAHSTRRERRAAAYAKEAVMRSGSQGSKQSPAPIRPASMARALFAGRALWLSVALILANVAVFAAVRHHDFINFDDPEYITGNSYVPRGLTWQGVVWAFTTGFEANWHPLTWLSHMMDVQFFGLNPGAYHVVNFLFHIINTLLLFGLLHYLTGALARSGFVAALFAVHPLHVEPVAWIAERKDVLSTMFWMLTLWAYVRYVRRPQSARYVLICVLFVLGLLAKPMLVTLPFTLLLLDVWPLARVSLGAESKNPAETTPLGLWPTGRRLVVEKLPLFALSAVSCVVTFLAQKHGGAVRDLELSPFADRVPNALVSYAAYLFKMLWPMNLAGFYPYHRSLPPGLLVGAIAILICISVVALRGWPQRPYLLVGWFWYVGTLVPVIGLVQVGSQSMADRYTYVPLIGIFLMLAWGIPNLAGRSPQLRAVLPVLGVLVVLGCGIIAQRQVGYWRNSMSLWKRALEVTTENDGAHTLLASELVKQGRVEEGIGHYNEALRIRPRFAQVHNNLAVVLGNQGRLDEAIPHYEEAVRLKPDFAEAHDNLGQVLAQRDRTDDAVAQYAAALRAQPDYVEAHINWGFLLAQQGKFDEAIVHYNEALRIKPDFALAHSNLGIALAAEGRNAEASAHFRESLRLNPENPTARRWLNALP